MTRITNSIEFQILVQSLADRLNEDETVLKPGHHATAILADFAELHADDDSATVLRSEEFRVHRSASRVVFQAKCRTFASPHIVEKLCGDEESPRASPGQIKIAHALARGHGHSWGGLDGLPEIPLSEREIYRMYYVAEELGEVCEGPFAGIRAPSINFTTDGEVVISHTTYSRRLTWEIFEQQTVISISRPHGVVLRLQVPSNPEEKIDSKVFREVGYCTRHAEVALSVLLVVSEAAGRDKWADYDLVESLGGTLEDPAYRDDAPFPRFGRTSTLHHPAWHTLALRWCVQDGRTSVVVETEEMAREAWRQLVSGKAVTAAAAVGNVRRSSSLQSRADWLEEVQDRWTRL